MVAPRRAPSDQTVIGHRRVTRRARGEARLERTPKPRARRERHARERAARFLVQEHHAHRRHWDLRLEHDGVLCSWAVPKGIPTRPAPTTSPVRTEDHRREHLSFEGVIPKGQHGAGTMTAWDSGAYDLEKWTETEVMITYRGRWVRAGTCCSPPERASG